MLSVHTIVGMKLKMKTPRHSSERKQSKGGNVNWDKTMNLEIVEQYRKRTEKKTVKKQLERA